MSKNAHADDILSPIIGNIISFGVGFACYIRRQSRAKQRNKLRVPTPLYLLTADVWGLVGIKIRFMSRNLRIGIIALLPLFMCLKTMGQPPSSVNYKKNDFFLNVIYNPSFSLCNFKDIGLNEGNTSLEEEELYQKGVYNNAEYKKILIAALGKSDRNTIHTAYLKVKAAWKAFKEIQHTKECVDVSYSPHNIFAPTMDAELRHKLSIVPLKLKYY